MTTNLQIANLLEEMARYKEYEGQNSYRIAAYRNAAKIVSEYTGDLTIEDIRYMKGIGESLASKIREAARTGKIQELEEMKKRNPDLVDLTKIPGVGPKKAMKLFKEYGVRNRNELENKFSNGDLIDDKLHKSLKFSVEESKRIPRLYAEAAVWPLLASLKDVCDRVEIAGSARRKKETVKDIDILVTNNDIVAASQVLFKYGEKIESGSTRCAINYKANDLSFRVDLRMVDLNSFGAALNYFTGSREHNIALRRIAKDRGLLVNEYGIFRDGEKIGGKHEEDLYEILHLPYVPPELREGYEIPSPHVCRGLVDKVTEDYHIHTIFSDGDNTPEEYAIACYDMGYKDIGFADHISPMFYGNKLYKDPVKFDEYINRVRKIELKYKGRMNVYCGAEVDINMEGKLTLPSFFEEGSLDFIIASCHINPGTNLKDRFVKASEHKDVAIIGHPTGRMFGTRPVAVADWIAILGHFRNSGILVEINGQPDRLDLPEDIVSKFRNEEGLFCLSSDAHNTDCIRFADNALAVARRAGLHKTCLGRL